MKKIDLHNHGPWTDFETGKFDIERFPRNLDSVANLAVIKGLDGMAITSYLGKGFIQKRTQTLYENVSQIPENKRTFEIERKNQGYNCWRKTDGLFLRIYDNCEYLTSDRGTHILISAVEWQTIPAGLNFEGILREVKERSGKIVLAHPFFNGVSEKRIESMKGYIDALEWNANFTFFPYIKNNEKVIKFGKRLEIPVIANSDAEQAGDIGRCYTEYDVKTPDEDSIFEALKKGDEENFRRNQKTNRMLSPFRHLFYIKYSEIRKKKGWIEHGLLPFGN